MRRLVFFAIFSLLCYLTALSQSDTVQKKIRFAFHGFIKSDYWYDTRQTVASREELFLFYPKNVQYDNNGRDVNAEDYVNFSPITSRVNVHVSGPKAFGADAIAFIEGDFSGVTNADINGLRLRHAYGLLKWEKVDLMFGQFWHPMFTPEVIPSVISLNTGAPFQPFIRNPLLTVTYRPGKLSFIISAIGQRDNANDGPAGYTGNYLRNNVAPNLHFQMQLKTGSQIAGLAADWKSLRPRLVTDKGFITRERVHGFSYMCYWKFTAEKFSLKAKSIYGQNLTEHLLLGGYAVRSVDTITGVETYTPTNHLFVWGNFVYGKKIQAGLFGGYARNFGTSHKNTGKYYARGQDIAYLYRVSGSVSWISGPVQISFEPEYTVAAYGIPSERGLVENVQEVANLRLLLTFFYFF